MQTEKNYIDLYRTEAARIDRNAAPVLNALRPAALKRFESVGLPGSSNEEYRRNDVRSYFAIDYGLNLDRLEIPVNPYEAFRCDVPNLSTALYFLVNDSFYPACPQVELSEGVLVGSLRAFARSHPDLLARFYGRVAPEEAVGTTALNTLFAQDGFLLYVPRNTILKKPLQLVNILHGRVDLMVNRRLLVVLEEGAQAKLLVCDHSMDERVKFLSNQVCEISVGKNAVLDFYEMEETSLQTTRIAATYVRQAEGSKTTVNGITLHNGVTRNDYVIRLEGEGAETSLNGMAIADRTELVDNHSLIEHRVPRCTSNELFKYVLNDTAQGIFHGRIRVAPGAQQTAAYQNNRNLCVSPGARMYTKPQLEIYADDVKCSHGATVGQLDPQALFYLRSRGIPEKEAQMLLMFAFMHDVIDQIGLESLQDRLRQLVEKRFRGELSKCAGCAVCS